MVRLLFRPGAQERITLLLLQLQELLLLLQAETVELQLLQLHLLDKIQLGRGLWEESTRRV